MKISKKIGTVLGVVFCLPVCLQARENLFLIGGGKHPPAVLEKFVDAAGGDRAHILIVTWATAQPDESYKAIAEELKAYNPESIAEAERDPKSSDGRSHFREQLRESTGIYFTGGDQNKITKNFDNRSLTFLKRRYHNGLAVAGTSAGTAIMSPVMFTGNVDHGDYEIKPGIGLLAGALMDTHFLVRHREGRMKQGITKYPDLIGLGVDEDNGIWVIDQSMVRPFGPSELTVYHYDKNADDVLSVTYREGDSFKLPSSKSSAKF